MLGLKQALIIYHFCGEKSIKNEVKKAKNKKYSENFEKVLAKSTKIVYNGKVNGELSMSVNTNNAYGRISISDLAIAKVASHTALESYGIVEMVSRRFTDSLSLLMKKEVGGKGIKVTTSGNRIYVDVYVIIKYGVSISAVAESLKEAIKYKVEAFAGMIVDTVNVNVIGVKL